MDTPGMLCRLRAPSFLFWRLGDAHAIVSSPKNQSTAKIFSISDCSRLKSQVVQGRDARPNDKQDTIGARFSSPEVEPHIPKKPKPSDTEMQVHQFLEGHIMLGPELGELMVRLELFASRIRDVGFDAALIEVPGSADVQSADDLIRDIAAHISANASGVKGDLLRKSLQETFYQISGTAAERGRAKLGQRLDSFLTRRGTSGIIQNFLCLHVFNIVWFQTSDSFRSLASTPDSLVDKMESVEQTCRRIVNSIWRSQHVSAPLDAVSADALIQRLLKRLTGSLPGAA
jgi:hypothetical protein